MTAEHESTRLLLGAYVLGGLSAEDRALVDRHLAACEVCRAEAASFAVVPGLLGRGPVPGERTEELEVPSFERLRPLLVADSRRAAVRRRIGLVAAAACLALLAGLVGWSLPRPSTEVAGAAGGSARVVGLTATTGASAAGQAVLDRRAWGTALHLEVSGLPGGGPMRLEVTDDAGRVEQAAVWGPTATGRAVVDGASSIIPERITRVVVLGPTGEVLAATR